MTQTVAVIGASSFVGARLYFTLGKVLPRRGDFVVTGTHFSRSTIGGTEHLDLTCSECVRDYLLRWRPDVVILVAGTKDVRRCEQDYDFAFQLNTAPVDTLCGCIAEHDLATRLLYISSDYVFDGISGGYRANDPPSPVTNYGRTKVLGEQRALRGDVDAYVLRTAAVMGCHGSFLGWLVGELQTHDSVTLLDNSFFSPTPVELLADCIVDMIAGDVSDKDRVLHAVGPRRMSRFSFGALVLETLCELGMDLRSCRLEREFLPGEKDLSLIPSPFSFHDNNRNGLLETYLRQELHSCIA